MCLASRSPRRNKTVNRVGRVTELHGSIVHHRAPTRFSTAIFASEMARSAIRSFPFRNIRGNTHLSHNLLQTICSAQLTLDPRVSGVPIIRQLNFGMPWPRSCASLFPPRLKLQRPSVDRGHRSTTDGPRRHVFILERNGAHNRRSSHSCRCNTSPPLKPRSSNGRAHEDLFPISRRRFARR
jgi:hypothetical protein